MLGVCTIWDTTFATQIAIKRWYNMTKQTAKAFGATHLLWVTGPEVLPGIVDQEITTEEHESLAAIRTAYPDAELVFLDASGSPLSSFTHPAGDSIYVVGTDNDGLENLPPLPGESVVAVSANIELWAHVALGAALMHRGL